MLGLWEGQGARRCKCWVRQAVYLLVFVAARFCSTPLQPLPIKKEGLFCARFTFGTRQAAYLLGSPSGVNTGSWVAAKREVAGFALLQRLYEVLLQDGDGGGVGQRAVFAVGEVEGIFDFFAVGADFGVADVDVVREQDAADV